MTAYDDVLHTEVSDGIFKHGVRVQIRGRDKVADIAVDEDLSRLQTHDGVDRDTAVRASEVEVARLLRTPDPLFKDNSEMMDEGCVVKPLPKYFASCSTFSAIHSLLRMRMVVRS